MIRSTPTASKNPWVETEETNPYPQPNRLCQSNRHDAFCEDLRDEVPVRGPYRIEDWEKTWLNPNKDRVLARVTFFVEVRNLKPTELGS
jgi:hypothetical protein